MTDHDIIISENMDILNAAEIEVCEKIDDGNLERPPKDGTDELSINEN